MTMDQAADMMTELTKFLNSVIIETNDEIKENNHELWNRFFHEWSNADWDGMLTAMEHLEATAPWLFEPFHRRNLLEARKAWHKQRSCDDRILDTKPHKRKAWKMAMTIREVVNAINGVDLPNKPGQGLRHQTQPKPTVFGQLFSYS